MSSIYDNKKNAELLDGGSTSPTEVNHSPAPQSARNKEEAIQTAEEVETSEQQNEGTSSGKINQELASYQKTFASCYGVGR